MRKCVFLLFVILVTSQLATAQNPANDEFKKEIENLKATVQQLKETVDKQQQRIDELERAKRAAQAAPAQPVTAALVQGAKTPEQSQLLDQLAKEIGTQQPNRPWPAKPLFSGAQGGGQGAYANISLDVLGLAGTTSRADVGSVDLNGANQRGFSVQEAEIFIDGAVDPYFYGAGNFSFTTDPKNTTSVEIEEAFLRTLSLPYNLQVQAGQYHTAFGRLNLQHTHMWDFVDPPLVNARFFGDGLRNPGVQISWLAPIPFYTVAYFSVQDSTGDTATSFLGNFNGTSDQLFGRLQSNRDLHSVGDLLFVPRITSSFDLTDTQTVTVGASGAFGPNASGPGKETDIFGVDAYWKWKPANAHGGWPFLKWQTEAMARRYEAGEDPTAVPALPNETLWDWGAYSQLVWGFTPCWTLALRGDYEGSNPGAFAADQIDREQRWRVSPALTWYLSEFSKLRLQYNFDEIEHVGPAHSVWFQFEYVLGAHGAHPY